MLISNVESRAEQINDKRDMHGGVLVLLGFELGTNSVEFNALPTALLSVRLLA